MIKYVVYTRNRMRGIPFDDLAQAIKAAGAMAVDFGFEAVDMEIEDSLHNKRRWQSIDRGEKRLVEPSLVLSEKARSMLETCFKAQGLGKGDDRLWIEPGGDVKIFEARTGCSRSFGTVDGLLRDRLGEMRSSPEAELGHSLARASQ